MFLQRNCAGFVPGSFPVSAFNFLRKGTLQTGEREQTGNQQKWPPNPIFITLVLTYARPRPFDREVFNRFGDYLNRELRRPRVLLDRPRIARRHCHAFLLGRFFQFVYPPSKHVGAMQAFGRMGLFCGATLPGRWRDNGKPTPHPPAPDWEPAVHTEWWDHAAQEPGLEKQFLNFLCWLRSKGEAEYRPQIEKLLHATPLATIENWAEFVDEIEKSFLSAVQSWREDYDALLAAWDETTEQRQANALRYQLSALYDTTVIEALADRQFLPRYGFPIGLQKLQVIVPDEGSRDGERVKIREEDQFRLERPGLLALREYVPGSQLLAGGKLITSRGLRKHWTGIALDNYVGLTGQYAECQNRHFYYEISKPLTTCPICDQPVRGGSKKLLLPKHGFSSAAWDPPRRSTDVERVGSVERATITFSKRAGAADATWLNFGGISGLTARYREAGELLVYNSGAIWEEDENEEQRLVSRGKGFAICLKCGYADSEQMVGDGRMHLPPGFVTHAPLTAPSKWSQCWREGEAPVLRNQTLAARETTDVLLLTFEGELTFRAKDQPLLETLGHALQIAGAKLLELDTRELGVMLSPTGERAGEWGVVIYDNTPGGAGHVREFLAIERDWLKEARQTLYLNEAHHARCETACLDCLLTFDAQEAMGKGLLQRRRAFEVLEALLKGEILPTDNLPLGQAGDQMQSSVSLTNEQRRARAQQRSSRRRQ